MRILNRKLGKQAADVVVSTSSPVPQPHCVMVEEKQGPGGSLATASSWPSAWSTRCPSFTAVWLYLVACLLLYVSWWGMYSSAEWPIAYAGTARGSAFVQALLWWLALLLEVVACELVLLRVLFVVPLRVLWSKGVPRCAAAAVARWGCHGRDTAGAAMEPLLSARLAAFFAFLVLVPFAAQILIWTIVRSAIPRKYYQTYEVVYTLTRCLYDLLFLSVVTLLLCMRGLNRAVEGCRVLRLRAAVRPSPRPHEQASGRKSDGSGPTVSGLPSPKQFFPYYYPSFLLVTLLLSAGTMWLVHAAGQVDAVAVMRRTVLGDTEGRNRDFCQVDGGTLDYAALRRAWVLPELLPRRFFNFYSGSTQCSRQVRLAYLDERSKQLVMRATCPPTTTAATSSLASPGVAVGASPPRVFLNLAPHNAFMQTDMTPALEELSDFVHEHYRYYPNRTRREDIILHHVTGHTANASRRLLQAVELRPSALLATRRPLTAEERRRFPSWGTDAVTVPLGQVLSYVVRCDGREREEEVWIYPLDRTADAQRPFPVPHSGSLQQHVALVIKGDEEQDVEDEDEEEIEDEEDEETPPMSLLVLMLDAVSRPEVLRSLPRWRQWLRDFQRRQAQRGAAGHLVVEARAHTTIDHSTRPNLLSTLAGAAEVGYDGVPLNDTAPPYTTSIFTTAKARYGSRLHTALLVGYCEDYLKQFFRYPNATFGGFGSAVDGVDSYVFGPFCERRYAAMQSNFYGPYSVVRRCLGHLHVHEIVLDYTRALVLQQLQRVRASSNHSRAAQEAFLYFATLIDGHEGTHGVLYLLDEALTLFMKGLEEELRFFDDPRHGLLLFSDHGNHMGPYYMTYPGELERALPFLVLVVHPSVLDRVDRHKRRPPGTAHANLLARTNGFTSPMDTYLTLCDLLHVPTSHVQMEAPPSAVAAGTACYPFSLLDSLPEDVLTRSKLSRSGGYRTMYGAVSKAARKQATQFCEFDS